MTVRCKRAGFTLIEMLVVIAIIGILVGLLLPAINLARESARQTTCINNQKQLSHAIISYEGAKGRLPGIVNRANPLDMTTKPPFFTNWVMAIFGQLDRNDLMNYWMNGIQPGATSMQPVVVDLLLCPSNNQMKTIGGLSYIVNMGVYPTSPIPNLYDLRLFRNRATVTGAAPNPEPDFSFVSLNHSTRTVMLSENLNSGPWSFIPGISLQPGVQPLDGSNNFVLAPLAFIWPNQALDPTPTSTDPRRETLGLLNPTNPLVNGVAKPMLSSFHRGKIVVTFCDGHTEMLPESTYCWKLPTDTSDVPSIFGTP
jgi:prepilin-type N-terminal cleavage/methylation domain-containing protein/prepilin-type processing-associated H-X9-DG protein